MRKFLLCCLVGCLAILNTSFAQDFSNKGKEFWLAYSYHVGMVNTGAGGAPSMTLNITSDVTTSYTVEIWGGAVISTGIITANAVTNVTIPNSYFVNADGIFNDKAIHVISASPIVVYSFITRAAASAATLCLPTPVLGKQYYAMSFTQVSNEQNSCSFITIVAVEDNTTVEIIPTAATRGGWAAGSTNTINLNKGQVYQVLGTTTGNNGVDLSGSSVRSIASGTGGCKRIAVFSGSGKLALGCSNGSADNLYQQLYPVASWGSRFLTVPSNSRTTNFYRIMRSDPASVITLNGTAIPSASFINGYYTFSNTTPNLIVSNFPISVTQYFTSQNCSGNGSPYDPDMIVLNPVEQNIKNVTLVSSNLLAGSVANHQHHLHVIMRNTGTGISSFRFDGATIPPSTAWVVHPSDPSYSYLYLPFVSETSHSLVSDSGFNALAYGYANAETYGYSAGTNVKDLSQQIGVATQYGIESSPSVCAGSPFKFKISLPYQPLQLDWDFFGQQTNATQTGPSANMPVPNDSITTVNGKTIYWYSLPSFYTYNTPGSYNVHINATTSGSDGCGSLQEIDFVLEVSAPPVAGFTYTQPACTAEVVQFTDTTVSVKPNYSWYWNFDDPGSGSANTSNLRNPTHTFSAPGIHNVRFASITTPGCLSDTITTQINVPALPSGTISGSAAVCENAASPVITFTATGGTAPYTFTYNINGGPDQTINTTGTSATVTLNSPTSLAGVFTYTLTNIKNLNSAICTQNISGQTAVVTVNTIPTATINGTATVCQNSTPPDISFTGTNGTAPYIFTYTKNGGTPITVTTTSGNNSVTVPVPTGTPGTFVYELLQVQESSSGGCTRNFTNTTATVTVNQLPTATISGTTSVCASAVSPDITLTALGGVTPYTFSYTLNGSPNSVTTASGNNVSVPVPTSAPGTFVYNLVSVQESSSIGCMQNQTGTATVTVHPKPTASFSTVGPYCSQLAVTFTPVFGISPNGSVTSWVWDYGDGAGSQTRPDGNPFTVTYPTSGIKQVTFKTISDNGCQSDVFQMPVTINSKPKAGFINPASCLADANAQFTDTSTVAGSGASIVYWEWDFGDGSPVFAGTGPTYQNPAHAYTAVGQKTVKLIITTNSGCKDTVIQQFFINGEVTKADFIVQNPSNLCSNRPVQIKENSVVNVGGLIRTDIYWDYTGNPTAFDQDNNPTPGKIYTHYYPNLQTDRVYSIRYFAYSGFNGVCQKDTIINITVRASPVAQFTSVPDVCLNGGPVVLTQGTASGGTGVYMGPGVTFSGGVYTFDPLASGVVSGVNNTVIYTVTSPSGCDSAKVQQIKVLVPPTVNSFTPVGNMCHNNAINFQNTFTNGDGNIVKWIYNWNDGSPIQTMTTGADVTHSYSTPGMHTASLTLETDYGCRNTPFTITFTVNPLPVPDYTFSSACLPAANINFTNTTPSPANYTYLWSFELPSSSPANTSTLTNPSHTYTSQGPFNTSLIATDITTGCSDTSAIKIVDNNAIHPEPVLQFTAIPDVCLNNGTVQLTQGSETSGMSGGPGTYSGSGVSPSGLFNPQTAGVGTHTLTYTWTSSFNCTSSVTQNVKVLQPPSVIGFTVVGNKCEKSNTTFQNSVTPGDGIVNTWVYDWGDGTPTVSVPNGNNVTHNYAVAGSYTATLYVITDRMCKSAVMPLVVEVNPLPRTDFTYSDTSCLPNAKVVFKNTTPNINDWAYSWNFDFPSTNGSDMSSQQQNVTHTYTTPAPHNVKLTARSGLTGCTKDTIKPITTIHPAPVAMFSVSNESICINQSITVLDQSTFADGTPGSWLWNYGDSTAVAEGRTQPPHTYTSSGSPKIKLTIFNSFGCVDDTVISVRVNPNPIVDAGPGLYVLLGNSITLQARATGNDLSYQWEADTQNDYLNNSTILQPVSTPAEEVLYTLTVFSRGGCVIKDTVSVKLLKVPDIPNTFTPNNDGVHDRWEIAELKAYPNSRVQVFTRTGQLVFESKGYSNPWDGTFKGKILPFDTYYYIIEPGSGRKPYTGYVTIVR